MKSYSIWSALALVGVAAGSSTAATVSTLIGTGTPGFSDNQVANPYGLVIGPDGALYFCDLDNQRVRRLDLATKRTTTPGTGNAGIAATAALPSTRL
jgi:sugar lactone lactonase YvrE